MKRRFLAVVAALAMALAMTIGAGAPAQAAVPAPVAVQHVQAIPGTGFLATVYWGCPSGVACVWINDNGGGSRLTISVGQFGTNHCISFAGSFNNSISSMSNDYGSGLRLHLYDTNNCTFATGCMLTGHCEFYGDSSHGSWSFIGPRAYFNDITSSAMIK